MYFRNFLLFLMFLIFIGNVISQETNTLYPIRASGEELNQYGYYDALYGFINNKGEIIIEPQFKNVRDFSDGFCFVETWEGDSFFIDENGNLLFDCSDYSRVSDFSEGLSFFRDRSRQYNLVNNEGELIVKLDSGISIKSEFSEGLAVVENDGLYGYLDSQGIVVIPFSFQKAYPFSEGYARVIVDQKSYFINHQGNIAIDENFMNSRSFSSGLAAVQNKSGFWGYIDNTGKWKIDAQYSEAYDFNSGLALVHSNSTILFIDTNGEIVLDNLSNDYSDAKSFNEYGYGFVKKNVNERWAIIDTSGSSVFDDDFSDVNFFNGVIGLVYQTMVESEVYGRIMPSDPIYIDHNGETITPFILSYQ